MQKNVLALVLTLVVSSSACADFINDSTVDLTARNFYFSRDYRQSEAIQSKRAEWAQGFILKANSGYTAGAIGFGLDLHATLGIKLDSSDSLAGTGLLPNAYGNSGPDEYTDISGVFKTKLSETELKAGGFTPKSPVLLSSDARLLPPIFNGITLLSNDIDNLTVNAGQFDSVNYRNSSSNSDNFVAANYGVASRRFRYIGMDYRPMANITTSLWRAELKDVYQQNYAGIQLNHQSGGLLFGANVGYFSSSGIGVKNAGSIENNLLTILLSTSYTGHGLKFGYQANEGRSPFPYLLDSYPNTANSILILEFTRAQERSWQIGYDLDLARFGLPGLNFFTLYVRGDNYTVGGHNGNEWERDIGLSYVVQSGPVKGLGVRWRNAMVRSDTSIGDIDENRLILSYTLPLR